MAPAHFTATTVYVGEQHHKQHGLVHVLGYQNTTVNRHSGPNAMILHIPAGGPMDETNFIDTRGCRRFLKDMVEALTPRPFVRRGGPVLVGASLRAAPVYVFEHDIYTVVLSSDASRISEALSRVPEHKRPVINQPLFDFYAREFPNWHLALCCFDNREAAKAAPMLTWYHPMNGNRLMLPSLDGHTGDVPDIYGNVIVDHWVVFGSDRLEPDKGAKVYYGGGCGIEVSDFLPARVMGRPFRQSMRNGDFVIDLDDMLAGDVSKIMRVPAPSTVLA